MKLLLLLGFLLAFSGNPVLADAPREQLPSWLAGSQPPTVPTEEPGRSEVAAPAQRPNVEETGRTALPSADVTSTQTSSASLPFPPQSAPKPPTAPAAVAKPTFDSAMKAFNERRFREAKTQFQQLGNQTRTEKVQYYLGRCAQQMAQVAEARAHYAWVIQYGKDATLKSYASTGYNQMATYSQHRTYQGAPSSG